MAVPLALLVCSGIAFAALFGSERKATQRERASAAQDAGATFRERLNTTVARLSTTSGLFAASHNVTEAEFRQFTFNVFG